MGNLGAAAAAAAAANFAVKAIFVTIEHRAASTQATSHQITITMMLERTGSADAEEEGCKECERLGCEEKSCWVKVLQGASTD